MFVLTSAAFPCCRACRQLQTVELEACTHVKLEHLQFGPHPASLLHGRPSHALFSTQEKWISGANFIVCTEAVWPAALKIGARHAFAASVGNAGSRIRVNFGFSTKAFGTTTNIHATLPILATVVGHARVEACWRCSKHSGPHPPTAVQRRSLQPPLGTHVYAGSLALQKHEVPHP
jgi:hypothetical protein